MRQRSPARALFVSHQASRTGAPTVLLHFLRWLRRETSLEFEVLLLRGGPLAAEFADLAPVHVLRSEPRASDRPDLETGLEHLGQVGAARAIRTTRYRWALRRHAPFDLVYLNSAATWRVVRALTGDRPTVVGHAHELEYGLQNAYPRDGPWLPLTGDMDLVVAASDAIRDNLVASGVPPERVECHYPFVDAAVSPPSRSAIDALRSELGIGSDTFVVGAAGAVDWRKGPDLFVHVAAAVRRRCPDARVQFVWIGGPNMGRSFAAVEHEIRHSGVGDLVRFAGEQDQPLRWLALFDVLALTSREDPFPLVALEASMLSTPVVCFDAGGIPRLLRPDRGVVVPYADVESMANAILALCDDETLRRSIGERAREEVLARHVTELGAPELWAAVRRAHAGRTG